MTEQISVQHDVGPGRSIAIRLTEGMPVEATDGHVGEIADVIVEPVRRRVTHLVVQHAHHHEQARLIPIDAAASFADNVVLSWSTEQVEDAPRVEETNFVERGRWPHPQAGWGIGPSPILAWPYYGAGGLGLGMGVGTSGPGWDPVTSRYDRIPEGTAEISRASEVVSVDDHVVGHVDGFIVDPDDGITHIIVERGHLWGHRTVTIPMREVESVTSDRLHLRARRDEIGGFPTMPFHHHESVDPRTGVSGDSDPAR